MGASRRQAQRLQPSSVASTHLTRPPSFDLLLHHHPPSSSTTLVFRTLGSSLEREEEKGSIQAHELLPLHACVPSASAAVLRHRPQARSPRARRPHIPSYDLQHSPLVTPHCRRLCDNSAGSSLRSGRAHWHCCQLTFSPPEISPQTQHHHLLVYTTYKGTL